MNITKKALTKYIDYRVAPGYHKCLNKKGLEFYKKKLAVDLTKGKKVKI